MQRIDAYRYQNRVEVLAEFDPTLTTRNIIVYARTIKVHRGIDNTLVFYVKNSDQKSVNLTGYRLLMSVVDDENASQFFEVEGTPVDITRGSFSFVIDKDDVNSLTGEWYNYALKAIVTATNQEIEIYTDDFFTVRGQIQVLNGYNPGFKTSGTLTFTTQLDGSVLTSLVSGSYPTGFADQHTFQFYFNNFTGSITPQVTTQPIGSINENSWVNLPVTNYTSQTMSTFANYEGGYTAIRFRIVPTSGSVTKILARS